MKAENDGLDIVVVGASGHLARTKIFPALFALYCQEFLPPEFRIIGYARSDYTDEAFRDHVAERLTCRYVPGERCADRMSDFLARCNYMRGTYDSVDGFLDLYRRLRELQGREPANRLFYLAIPPSQFLPVAQAIGGAGLVSCGPSGPWSRVVIEKPFGRDRPSSDRLTNELSKVFTEDQTYRIDHYLGKEVIQNLMVLRFANRIFEPLWHHEYVEQVDITWKEDLTIEGRGGYFDSYGIIRDVVQNHLLQMLALTAMEPPDSLDARHVRDEKVRVLKSVLPPSPGDVVLGQYVAVERNGLTVPGYRDDPSVRDDSRTPTFAEIRLALHNPRWRNVPFVIRAGKGMNEKLNEIRLRFREVPGNVFCHLGECPEANELAIRVQPREAIFFSICNKRPGLGIRLARRNLDLQYGEAFREEIPDAYESLLLDVLRGEKSLFIRSDELAAAWDVFTPLLHAIEQEHVEPLSYPFGSAGPIREEEKENNE